MKITENAKEIIIQVSPSVKESVSDGFLVVFTLAAFLFALSFIIADLPGFFQEFQNNWLECSVTIAVLLLIIILDRKELAANLLKPFRFTFQTKLTINIDSRSIDFFSRDIFGGRTERYYFTQVKKFKSRKDRTVIAGKYFLALELANGKTIGLKHFIGKKEEMLPLVRKLNKLIKPPKARAKKSVQSANQSLDSEPAL